MDMKSSDGVYEPLTGHIVLEQCQAAVDMLGHRLIHVKRMDLKWPQELRPRALEKAPSAFAPFAPLV